MPTNPMPLQALYHAGLKAAGLSPSDEDAFDISILLEEACGYGRHDLPVHGPDGVPEEHAICFLELVNRWKAGEPLQYLIGVWEFYGFPFRVGPGVLIPRPDTETLVDTALSFLNGCQTPVICDLCAGSGCVCGSIARKRPDASLFAVEYSALALPYLKGNLEALRAGNVTVLECDCLCPPPQLPSEGLDLIVCNPPYLSQKDMDALDPRVRREPEPALYGGPDGYRFYRRIPGLYRPFLKAGGGLFFEVGYTQADAVSQLLRDANYRSISITKDLGGVQRVVGGIKVD